MRFVEKIFQPLRPVLDLSGYNKMRQFSNKLYSEIKNEASVGSTGYEKVVKVAVIGDPNAGKSTLINSLLGQRVTSVSRKVHTTVRNTIAVLNEGETQIIFIDTPGFVSSRDQSRHKLSKSMMVSPYLSLQDVDVVVVLHDAYNFSKRYTFSPAVLKALAVTENESKLVLALNKVDLVKDKLELLSLTKSLVKIPSVKASSSRVDLKKLFDKYEEKKVLCSDGYSSTRTTDKQSSQAHKFDEVFMISALNRVGLLPLKQYLMSCGRNHQWLYNEGFITDQSMDEIVVMCIREKILDNISEEIPYNIVPVVDFITQDENGNLAIQVTLSCPSKRAASAMMGKEGRTVRDIAVASELALSDALDQPVVLKLKINQSKEKPIQG